MDRIRLYSKKETEPHTLVKIEWGAGDRHKKRQPGWVRAGAFYNVAVQIVRFYWQHRTIWGIIKPSPND